MSVITRVYDDYTAAHAARLNVEALGLPGVEVSLMGNESIQAHYQHDPIRSPDEVSGTATGAGVGATIGGGAGLLAGLGMIAIPGVGPLVAAGWLAATAVGAAGGAVAGGAIGALADIGVPDEYAPVFSEAIRRGGVAVSVQFPESARADVEAALDRISTLPLADRRVTYEADGWRYDETEAERETRLRATAPLNPALPIV
ncbi:hypothetical protein [Neogemmobacter tilapiae]|uniref:DUF1269 domain-containing protein n=1 Tax=Neogemmobacter tilapiae TaxID=875041 RepID=A0A918WP19_9RHOB|nr:hypothetical protein [Gemmobacter tilapiae]GHC60935.1 hypothetical protein GCM10007315_26100 [Gemmobacter tilapiae]